MKDKLGDTNKGIVIGLIISVVLVVVFFCCCKVLDIPVFNPEDDATDAETEAPAEEKFPIEITYTPPTYFCNLCLEQKGSTNELKVNNVYLASLCNDCLKKLVAIFGFVKEPDPVPEETEPQEI